MKNFLTLAVAGCLLALPAMAQISIEPVNGGTGVDGAFNPLVSTTLDTDVQAVYEFTTLNIPVGVTVTVTGSQPLTIKVQGAAAIGGTLDGSGLAGAGSGNGAVGGAGGAGGPGAGAGGTGGCDPLNPFGGAGMPGTGRSPGQPGIDGGPVPGTFTDPVGGGGGGGNATAGASGGPPNAGLGVSQSGAGGPAVFPVRAGSGGGGGGCDIDSLTSGPSNDGGAGGGGGGGRICLYSDTSITISASGSILANGGNGGTNTGNGGAGGGGSGGSIELAAPAIINDGMLRAVGGTGGAATQTNCGCSPGGAGGDGAIELSGNVAGTGTTQPAAAVVPWGLILSGAAPLGSLNVIGNPGVSYVAALSFALGTPIPLGGGLTLDLDINDLLFQLTFPVNTLSSIVGGLSGTLNGAIGVNLVGIPPDTEATAWVQGVSIQAGTLTGASSAVPIRIKF